MSNRITNFLKTTICMLQFLNHKILKNNCVYIMLRLHAGEFVACNINRTLTASFFFFPLSNPFLHGLFFFKLSTEQNILNNLEG